MTAPANDDFANAQPLAGLGLLVSNLDTTGATLEAGEPEVTDESWEVYGPYATDIGATVWFTWVPPADGDYTLSTKGSDFDTVLAVYTATGPTISDLVLLATNDEGAVSPNGTDFAWPPGWSRLSVVGADASTTYYIQAGGFSGVEGLLSLSAQAGLVPRPDDPDPWDDYEWNAQQNGLPLAIFQVDEIAYGAGTYVAILNEQGGVDGPVIYHSADSVSWTQSTLPYGYDDGNAHLYAVAYGDGLFVAVGYRSYPNKAVIFVSDDGGASWDDLSNPDGADYALTAVAYGNGTWVALGNSGFPYSYRRVITSSDGANWSDSSASATYDASPAGVASLGVGITTNLRFLDGKFVAATFAHMSNYTYVSPRVTLPLILHSNDGLAWNTWHLQTVADGGINGRLYDCARDDSTGVTVAVGGTSSNFDGGESGGLAYALNESGTAWDRVDLPTSLDTLTLGLRSVAAGESEIHVLGGTGSPTVWSSLSDDLETWTDFSLPALYATSLEFVNDDLQFVIGGVTDLPDLSYQSVILHRPSLSGAGGWGVRG